MKVKHQETDTNKSFLYKKSLLYNDYLNYPGIYNDIKAYMINNYSLNLDAGFILLYFDKDGKLMGERCLPTIKNFNLLCQELLQLASRYKKSQIAIVRTECDAKSISRFEDYKNCSKLTSFANLLDIKLLDYIVMRGSGLESYRLDHSFVDNNSLK